MLELFSNVRDRLSLVSFLAGLTVGAVTVAVAAVTLVLAVVFSTVEEDGSGAVTGFYGVEAVYCLPFAPCQD